MGMIQPGQRSRLARESFREGRLAADLGWKNLQGHATIERLLPGEVNRAHAALAEELFNLQQREQRRQLGWRGRREPAAGRRRIGRRRRTVRATVETLFEQ